MGQSSTIMPALSSAKEDVFDLSAHLADAKHLIAFPSASGEFTTCNKVLFFLHQKLSKTPGVTIEQFEQNGCRSMLAYVGPTRPDRFHVLLNGHVDVVPGSASQFAPYEKDGRLYGRGALDMKIALLMLTETFCNTASRLPYTLGLQIVSDEETGGIDGAKYQHQQGVRCDFMLSGERTDFDITVSAKGVCRARVHHKGTSAHAAYPWEGKNSLLSLKDLIDKLYALYPLPMQEAWETTINIARISTSNITFNKIPDDAYIDLDIRFLPGDPHFVSAETATAFLQSLSDEIVIEIQFLDPPFHTSPDNPFVQKLAKQVQRVAGRRPQYLKRHGTADTRFYSDPGTAVVEFGLVGDNPHTDNEYIEIASIPQYYQILTNFLHSVHNA